MNHNSVPKLWKQNPHQCAKCAWPLTIATNFHSCHVFLHGLPSLSVHTASFLLHYTAMSHRALCDVLLWLLCAIAAEELHRPHQSEMVRCLASPSPGEKGKQAVESTRGAHTILQPPQRFFCMPLTNAAKHNWSLTRLDLKASLVPSGQCLPAFLVHSPHSFLTIVNSSASLGFAHPNRHVSPALPLWILLWKLLSKLSQIPWELRVTSEILSMFHLHIELDKLIIKRTSCTQGYLVPPLMF